MIDALLMDLSAVARQLLPILGAVALVLLCIVLHRLAKMVDESTLIIKELDPTVKSVNESLEKAQAPLDTVVKYSHTLDEVHDKTMSSMNEMIESAGDSVTKMKDYVAEKLQSADLYDEVRPADESELQKVKKN